LGICDADFSLLDRYLAQKDVREELGVGDRPWQSCSPDVYNDFLGGHLISCKLIVQTNCAHHEVLQPWLGAHNGSDIMQVTS